MKTMTLVLSIKGNKVDFGEYGYVDLGLELPTFRDLLARRGLESYALVTQSIAKAERSGDFRARRDSEALLDLMHVVRRYSERFPGGLWEAVDSGTADPVAKDWVEVVEVTEP